jgi:hypothetical protein
MSSYCPDCGSRAMNNDVCSNCHEELYILENQSDVIDEPMPEWFLERAAKQQREVNSKTATEKAKEQQCRLTLIIYR